MKKLFATAVVAVSAFTGAMFLSNHDADALYLHVGDNAYIDQANEYGELMNYNGKSFLFDFGNEYVVVHTDGTSVVSTGLTQAQMDQLSMFFLGQQ